LPSEVTKHDIATLSNDIVAGKFGVPSVSNTRHMRKAVSGLFNWAAEAGRDYVTASPCVNLPKLDRSTRARGSPLSHCGRRRRMHGRGRPANVETGSARAADEDLPHRNQFRAVKSLDDTDPAAAFWRGRSLSFPNQLRLRREPRS
jgi:hypothetical protein